jgi:outer membrane protein
MPEIRFHLVFSLLFIALSSVTAFSLFMPGYLAFADAPNVITLQEGLKIVSDESRVVKIAKLQEAMAESDFHVARSALLPRIDASAAHTSLSNQPAMLFNGQAVPVSDQRYASYSIGIRQVLFDFRGSLSRYEASRMMLEARKYDSAGVRNNIALGFTIAFYDFLESQYLVETANQEIERLEAHFRDATRLHEAGVITRNDLLQAQVRLSDARQKQLSTENLKAVLAANLNYLLLRPLKDEIQASEGENSIATPPGPDLEQAWKTAVDRRPELRIVDATLKAVDLERTSQKADFLPRFYVRGSRDYTENAYQLHEHNWALMLAMDVNLFEGGRNVAELQKNKNRKKQLLEQREKLIDEIKLEVQRYILDRQNASARILANKDAVDQAKENLRINRKRYKEGEGTATEVLDAVTLLTTAETNHIRSLYDYRKADASVHYAMGADLLEVYGR